MAVDTSRDAVEWLSDEASFDGRQECADTLLALLARAEAAEGREAACTLLTGTPGALTVNCIRGAVRCTERERIEAQRDAAIAERDRLAEALAQARREGMEAMIEIAKHDAADQRNDAQRRMAAGALAVAMWRAAAGEVGK